MARRIPGQRIEGAPEITVKPGNVPGSWDVYVMPTEERIEAGGLDPFTDNIEAVLLYTLDEANKRGPALSGLHEARAGRFVHAKTQEDQIDFV